MKLEFIKIEIQNFKSVGELVEINYEDLKGLNFIFGKNMDVPNAKNGSGKSSLFIDALVFALFGKTIKNTNNKYIPNRSMPTTLRSYVKVYFKSNEQLYSCETYGKIYGKVMGTIGMELLKLNDDYSVAEDLTQSSIAKTKQYIVDNVLGCTFNVFRSSVVMTSSDFTNFYEGMPKDQKRKYIEMIFNLDTFGEMYGMLKTNLNDIKKESSMIKNSLISTTKKIDDIKEKSETFEAEQERKQTNIKNEIVERVDNLKELNKEAEDIILEDISDINDEYDEVLEKNQKAITNKSKLETEVVKRSSDIANSQKMIGKMQKISEGLCPDCTKLINERYNYQENLDDIARCENDIVKYNEAIEKLNAIISNTKEKLSEIRKKQNEFDKKKREKDSIQFSIKSLKLEIKTLKEKLDAARDKTNPYEDLIKTMEKEKENAISQLNDYNKNIMHLEILKEACSENGIKKFIIKDIVKLLNSLIQKYLNEIGCEFIVYFDETFEFKFITTTGECEFSSFSAGEKQRIQIATLLAFRDLILNGKISSNIFIIDELLDANVDTACIENVMNILKRKAEESHQNIFMISHRSELADNMSFWNNILKVTKENQQSRYEII